MRMGMRRSTRLTNAFSKKVENHAAQVALHFMQYNFARIHKSLRITISMPFKLKDPVRKVGQQGVRTVEDIREPDEHFLRFVNPAAETMYWIQLGSDFDTRVWVKESELELAE